LSYCPDKSLSGFEAGQEEISISFIILFLPYPMLQCMQDK